MEEIEITNKVQSEKKVKPTKKKLWLLITIIVIALLMVGLVVWYVIKNKKDEIPVLSVNATAETNNETLLTSKFNIKSDIETNEEYLKETITIEPATEYEINKISNTEFEVTPKKELKANSIYNLVYINDESKYKWSFQTETVYKVNNIYPQDQSSYVYSDSVIEMDFSYIPNEDIFQYFEISPKVEGRFEYDNRRVRFVPDKLDDLTKYEVKIKEGFGNKENGDKLKETITSTFYTLAEENRRFIKNIYSYSTSEEIKVLLEEYYYHEDENLQADYKIYKYNNENQFLESLDKQKGFSYPSLIKIDTSNLKLIYNKKCNNDDFVKQSSNLYLNVNELLDEGYYVAVLNIEGKTYYVNMQVNDLITFFTYFDNKIAVWVNNLKDNTSVEGADVYINDCKVGSTNNQGYIFVDNNFQNKQDNIIKVKYANNNSLYLLAEYYKYEDMYYDTNQNLNSYIFIDRNRFKQGEKLNLWGFVKNRGTEEYKNVTIDIYKSGYNDYPLYTKQIELDEFGGYTDTVDLTSFDDGYYNIEVSANGKIISYEYFEIIQYNTKNYKIETKIDKDVVFAGEPIQLDISATLFDGTPISNETFNYSYFYNNNKKTGSVKTDENGNATVKLNTNYVTQYSERVYTSINISNENIEGEYDSNKEYFTVLPKLEDYSVEYKYDDSTNEYIFNVETYKYDKTNKSLYKGETTNRNVYITIEKYKREKVLDYTYFDENTKTTKEVYKTKSIFLGDEKIELATLNGKGAISYKKPFPLEEDGYIKYKSEMIDGEGEIIIDKSYYEYMSYMKRNEYDVDSPYSIKYDYNKLYKVNENIELELLKNEKNITTPIKVLYLIKSANGTEIKVSDTSKYSIKFLKEYGSNIQLKAYVFDGNNIYSSTYWYSFGFSLDQSELKLDVQISFDKDSYRPGEKATITVKTTDKGTPVSAQTNICAVDEAFIQEYGQDADIISSLYNDYYFNNFIDVISHKKSGEPNEGGGRWRRR